MTATDDDEGPRLPPARVFGGAAPLVVATASADGVPNVTYISKAHVVDDRRIALSDQFLGKTARNLIENPRASVLVSDPVTGQEWRLALVHERIDKRGPVFEAMRAELDTIAALTGMQDVFRLRSAHIYRLEDVVDVTGRPELLPVGGATDPVDAGPPMAAVGELCARLARCSDLDTLVSVTVDGVATGLGYGRALLLLVDEDHERLFTIASAGYDEQGVGSEVALGDGAIGVAAQRVEPVRIGNHVNMANFAQGIRERITAEGGDDVGRDIALPGLPDLQSVLAVPAVSLGELVGVVAVEDTVTTRYGTGDESALGLVASVLAGAIESIRAEERVATARAEVAEGRTAQQVPMSAPLLRFFPGDGSTFLDGDYLIKGVAGRLLWSLLRQHATDGRTEFTNREVRLDPTLDLPDFRDNLESRLILLKRRLDEREAAVRIEKTGRGRFRLDVLTEVRLEEAAG